MGSLQVVLHAPESHKNTIATPFTIRVTSGRLTSNENIFSKFKSTSSSKFGVAM